jgi:hypothetical protein
MVKLASKDLNVLLSCNFTIHLYGFGFGPIVV